MTEKRRPVGQKPLDELEWAPTPAEQVAGYLALTQVENEVSGVWAFAAFEALGVICRAAEFQEESLALQDRLEVPWWLLKSLAIGWQEYRRGNVLPNGRPQPMGHAFALEGGKGRRTITAMDGLYRDLMLTLEIVAQIESAKAEGKKTSIESVITAVADTHGISESQLWKIYNVQHGHIQSIYQRNSREG